MADIDTDGELIQGAADDRRAQLNAAAETKALDDRAAADRRADDNKRAADRKAEDRKADDQKRADDKRAEQRRDDARRTERKDSPASRQEAPESRESTYQAPQQDRFVDHQAEASLTQARSDFQRQEREIESAQSGAPSDRPRPPEIDGPLKPLDIAQDHKLHGERAAVEMREWEAQHRQVTERQASINEQIYSASPETPRTEPVQEVQGEPVNETSAPDQASAQQTMDVHLADQSQEQEMEVAR